MKKILAVITALSIALSIMFVPAQAAVFSDIEGHWAQGNIEAMAEKGYLNGYADGTFRPDSPINRAEFAKIICEVYDLPVSEYGDRLFSDVADGAWYAKYVPAFYYLIIQNFENEIYMSEESDNSDSLTEHFGTEYGKFFGAEVPLTRLEAICAVMTCGSFPESDGEEYDSVADAIAGVSEISMAASDFREFGDNLFVTFVLGLAMQRGLIAGDSQGRVNPYGTITRAELCALLERATSMYGGSADGAKEMINYFLTSFEGYMLEEMIKTDFFSEKKKTDIDNIVAATVNGEGVSLADYNFIYYDFGEQMQKYYMLFGITDWESQPYDGDDPGYEGQTCGEAARSLALDYIAELYAIYQKAEEAGIVLEYFDPRQQKIDFIKENFSDYNGFLAYLSRRNTSEYAFDKYFYYASMANEYRAALSRAENKYITEEEVNQKYLKASHVLIMIDDNTTDEEALAKANEVIARLDAGEEMALLVAEYGEDPGMKYRSYYLFTEGEMVDEFYEATKALEPGHYSSSPIKTAYGYHVIYRYPLSAAEEDTAYRDAVLFIMGEKLTERFDQWAQEAKIIVYDEVLER